MTTMQRATVAAALALGAVVAPAADVAPPNGRSGADGPGAGAAATAPGFPEAPLWPARTGDWVPARASCLLGVAGEDPAVRDPNFKSEDKWITVLVTFPGPAPAAFGHLSGPDFVPLADSGAVAYRTGVPPGASIAWAFAPSGAGARDPVRVAVVLLDRAAALPADVSVRPAVGRTFYPRAILCFDLDGDMIAEFPVHLETHDQSGFLPERCNMD